MIEFNHIKAENNEKACLVGFDIRENLVDDQNVSFEELLDLAKTAGVDPVATCMIKQRKINPAYYIGTGKVEEISWLCQCNESKLVIFDTDLSPAQMKNLEKKLEIKIIDRTGLILEIFAQRARSKEGKLQVELAQLEYLMPRLTKLWSHLSRQHGGVGTRGPGEKQIEMDRRQVQGRIRRLHELLENVKKQRATQRKRRQHSDIPVIAIVGYTNAGKSTFLRALTNADVLVENKLFATLDPTTRMYEFPSGEQFLFVDTVGFIRNIPHGLVEAFKATLEETHQADLLLHIADASAPDLSSQIEAVHSVLKELESDENPQLLVLNKIDLLSHRLKKEIEEKYPESAFISAQHKYGLSDLFSKLKEKITFKRKRTKLRLPAHKSQLLSKLHEQGKVLATEYLEDAILVEAFVPENLIALTRKYKVKNY